MTDTSYQFDKRTQRYHDTTTKRFVSESAIRELVEARISQGKQGAVALTQKLFRQQLSVGDWEWQQANLLKNLHLQLAKLGKGDELSYQDYGKVGFHLKQQYSRLRKFSYDILSGSQSEAQILNRIQMYFDKSRESFEATRLSGHINSGARWEIRITTAKESCTECITYAGLGYQPIGTMPNPTERCTCKSKCKCYKKYSWSRERPQTKNKEWLLTGIGWVA